ncbi:hypothetical protein EDB85DRAFT_2155771 [Lactarius pseudohatsudake]|nr:hypothetical protein EDB85DRAFT_2155771 [Lactarius pseudohatsudake]
MVRTQSTLDQFYIWRCLVNKKEAKLRSKRGLLGLMNSHERNKDDVAHLESLKKQYTERVQIYEVLHPKFNLFVLPLATSPPLQLMDLGASFRFDSSEV